MFSDSSETLLKESAQFYANILLRFVLITMTEKINKLGPQSGNLRHKESKALVAIF